MLAAELECIRTLQQLDLQWLMQLLTLAGYGELYLALFMYVYWCVSPAGGLRLGLFLIVCSGVNQLLKLGLHAPRPYWLQPDLLIGHGDAASGLPSGHAQSALLFWCTFAAWLRRWWFWLLAVALILGIGVSRVWLGVHFPHQVLAGWTVGLALWVLLQRAEPLLLRSLQDDELWLRLLSCLLASILLMLLGLMLRLLAMDWVMPGHWYSNALAADPGVRIDPLGLKGLLRDAGLLLGIAGGAVYLHGSAALRLMPGLRMQVFAGGGLGAGLIWYGGGWLRQCIDEEGMRLMLEYLRAFFLGLWISLGWPLLWHKLAGLHGRRDGCDA